MNTLQEEAIKNVRAVGGSVEVVSDSTVESPNVIVCYEGYLFPLLPDGTLGEEL